MSPAKLSSTMAALITPQICLRASKTIGHSPARAFLAIASCRTTHTSSSRLEFLLPSPKACLYPAQHATTLPHNTRGMNTATQAISPQPIDIPDLPPPVEQGRTIAIHNPQKDDNGKVMKVEITEQAAQRLQEIMRKDHNPHLALRITVEGGGCIGFQYKMALVTLPESYESGTGEEAEPALNTSSWDPNAMPSSPTFGNTQAGTETKVGSGREEAVLDDEDTVFMTSDGTQAKVVMNRVSLEVLKGSKVDFESALIGSQFAVTDNPRLKSSCGCKASFDIIDEV